MSIPALATARLAINGYDFRTWEPSAVAAVLDEFEVDSFELPYDTQVKAPIDFARTLRRSGTSFSGIYTSSRYALAGDDPAEAQRVAIKCLEMATEIGCMTVLVYLGHSPQLSVEAAIDRSAVGLDPVLQRAARYGVRIAVENLFDIKGNDPLGNGIMRTPDRIAALLAKVGTETLTINFDPCNFFIAGLSVPEVTHAYESLRESVTYIHLKDAVRSIAKRGVRWPAGRVVHDELGGDFKFTPIGQGNVDIEGFVSRLVDDGYGGQIVVEGLMNPILDTYRISLAAVRSYLAAAKPWRSAKGPAK